LRHSIRVPGASPRSRHRILVDARPLQGPSARRGIGRYLVGLLGGLEETRYRGQIGLLIDGGLEPPRLGGGGYVMFSVSRRYHGRFQAYEDAVRLPRELERIGPSLYHATNLALPGPGRVPWVVTLHDLIPWALPGLKTLGERIRYRPGRRRLAAASRIIAVSNSTATDAVRLAGVDRDRIEVVAEAVEPAFAPTSNASDRVASRFGLRQPYLLFAGALDRRKDPAALLTAWRTARQAVPSLQLALAGEPGRQAPSQMEGARQLGYVGDAELIDLLSAATALIFPSRYEGFALPPLEAMACGCPVIAYANSSLPELVGEAGILVADGDVAGLGRAAAEVALNRDLADRLRSSGLTRARTYSWTDTARRTAAVYDRALS